jgi:hypothetical protein
MHLFKLFAAASHSPTANVKFSSVGGHASATYSTGLPKVGATTGEFHVILQIVFGVLAGIAVLFVIIGALEFVVSAGNPEQATKARETIIYAIVGLVVSLSAEALVSFVLNRL